MQLSHDAIHWIVIIELKNKTVLSQPTSPRQSPQCISIYVFIEFDFVILKSVKKTLSHAKLSKFRTTFSFAERANIIPSLCLFNIYILRSDRTNRQNTILIILGEECNDDNIFAFVNAFDVKYAVIILFNSMSQNSEKNNLKNEKLSARLGLSSEYSFRC